MTRAEAYQLMQLVLQELLGDAEKLHRHAKNKHAKYAIRKRIEQIRMTIIHADEAE